MVQAIELDMESTVCLVTSFDPADGSPAGARYRGISTKMDKVMYEEEVYEEDNEYPEE